MVLMETLLDLGEHGVVALTCDSGSAPPHAPADRCGYARWHAPDTAAAPQDRRALFMASAAESPCWPWQALPLRDGHALMLFAGTGRPHLLRIVDVVQGQVRWERSIEALREELGIVPGAHMPLQAVIESHGLSHVRLYLGEVPPTLLAVSLHPVALTRVALPWLAPWSRLAFSAGFVIEHASGIDKTARFAPLAGDAPPAALTTRPAGRRFHVAVASAADRVALGMARGEVQVIDLPDGERSSLRPDDAELGADPPPLVLSPNGRWLLQLDGTLRSGTLVDLAQRRRAAVRLPEWDPRPLPGSSDPPLRLRATWALTNHGGWVLELGHARFTPFDALDWHALPAAPAAKPAAVREPNAALLATLRRPAATLKPTRRAPSHLHGAPHLAPGAAWPLHDGRAMLLLCEVALADAHAAVAGLPLPTTGWLQCFCATDAEGEPLIDDAFDPVALLVRHEIHPQAAPAPLPEGHAPGQPLRLAASRHEWPSPEHPATAAACADAAELHAYARWLDRRVRAAPAGLDTRLCGCATPLQAQLPELEPDINTPHELLLQLPSDNVHMWGTDTGVLYVLLPAGDGARGDFSRAVGVTQGY